MDNLNAHWNVIVQQVIHAAGHRCVFRAPYYPVDSPIEHLFNTVQIALTLAMYHLGSIAEVKNEFLKTMRNIKSFASYFEHVGVK